MQLDYNSPVIITYLILSFIALILNAITHGISNTLFFSSYRSFILNPLTYIRMITHSIGHSGFDHFIGNFMIILLIGPMIEEKYGSINLLFMFIITSVVIALFNSIISNYCITGASGNVYMLIALSSFSNISEGKIPVTLIIILIIYMISDIKQGIWQSLMNGQVRIYHGGHFIGALCGIAFGFYFLNNTTFPFLS